MDHHFSVDPSDPTPLYAQLERAIRSAIATGRLAVGAQLPTVRQLAVELRINANTVAKVYAELERAGVLETRRGVGTFVRSREPDVAEGDQAAHRRELAEIADRFVSEISTRGFSFEEVLEYLHQLGNQGD